MSWFYNQKKEGFTYKVMPFKDIPIGCQFIALSTIYLKKSSRTAAIVSPSEYQGTWFYFAQKHQYVAEIPEDMTNDD